MNILPKSLIIIGSDLTVNGKGIILTDCIFFINLLFIYLNGEECLDKVD